MIKRFSVACIALLMVAGCFSEPAKTTIVVEPDANAGAALMVDFITVDSPELADHILNSAGGGWFGQKAAYMGEYGDRLATHHYQLVPGSPAPEEVEWPSLGSSGAVYLIAGNFLAGPRILKVAPSRLSGVTIATNDFVLNFK